jgi:hypothetical protein
MCVSYAQTRLKFQGCIVVNPFRNLHSCCELEALLFISRAVQTYCLVGLFDIGLRMLVCS